MKLVDVFMPKLDGVATFKVLTEDELNDFLDAYHDQSRDEYALQVIEVLIWNLTVDVKPLLKKMPKKNAHEALRAIYNGCIMLNPRLDYELWTSISESWQTSTATPEVSTSSLEAPPLLDDEDAFLGKVATPKPRRSTLRFPKAKFMNLERHLKSAVIGQDAAVDELVKSLTRAQAGLSDDERPIGVFLFAGASGIGKTHLAKELHKYLFDAKSEIIRIDCGEFQHKHENQKLIGAPPGYLSHDEGGQLTNAVRDNPKTVVLLDEVEKAHPDIWNTFLRVFDEGMLTDSAGDVVSFRETIVIMTTNLGNQAAVKQMLDSGPGFGRKLRVGADDAVALKRETLEKLTHEEINEYFRPEFLNRIDKTIVFNNLTVDDYRQVAELEMQSVNDKLSRRGWTLSWDDAVLDALVAEGVNPIQGARRLGRVRRDVIETKLANLVVNGRFPRGTLFQVVYDGDLEDKYTITPFRPRRAQKGAKQE